MKKMVFTLAVLLGLGSSVAFAGNQTLTDDVVTVAVDKTADFTPIELKDLPQAVQDTLAKDFADLTPKSAEVSVDEETETSVYKVNFVDAEGNESSELFSEKGEVLK